MKPKVAIRQAEAVVFAMPMSPVTSRSTPAATSSVTTPSPASSALAASSRVIAGPSVRSAVPGRTLA